MITPIFTGTVTEGRLELDNRDGFKKYLYNFNSKVELLIRKPRADRSNQQNRYYWGVVIELIAEATSNEQDDIHEFLRQEFLTKTIVINESPVKITRSTASLSTVEFEDYLLRCRTWASEFLNITVPLPNEADY